MKRLPLNLTSVRAIRQLRLGSSREAIGSELGISLSSLHKIEDAFCNVPDTLIVGIERLLCDREKLQRLISNLMYAHD